MKIPPRPRQPPARKKARADEPPLRKRGSSLPELGGSPEWSILEYVPDAAIIADSGGRIRYINAHGAGLFGYTPEELIGRQVEALVPAASRRNHIHHRLAYVESPRIRAMGEGLQTLAGRRKDGSEFEVDISLGPILTASGTYVMAMVRDITDRRRLEGEVRASEELHRAVVENIADAIVINVGTTRSFVNRAYLELVGVGDKSEVLGRPMDQYIAPEDRAMVRERTLARQRGLNPPSLYEYGVLRADGETRVAETRAVAVTYRGQPAAMGILRDVTERRRAEEDLKMALSLQTATIESTADGILVLDASGKVRTYNRRFLELLGLGDSVIETGRDSGVLIAVLDHMKDADAFLSRAQELHAQPDVESSGIIEFKDGRVFDWSSLPQRVDGLTVGRVWSLRDVTERRQFEDRLRHQANHDTLTDLLNRRGFQDELAWRLDEAQRRSGHGAVLLLDLDQFKDVNDTLGHLAGDQVLLQVAPIMLHDRSGYVTARLGGDEFTMLLPGADVVEASKLADQVLEEVRQHRFEVGGDQALSISASAGIALYPQHGATVDQLMSRVDLALGVAKEEGRNRVRVYAAVDKGQSKAESRLEMRAQLREALDKGGLLLYGQGILDLSTRGLTQQEMLVRMKVARGRILPAKDFVHIAERLGFIEEIDRWVVLEAISLLGQYRALGREAVFEVNLSGKSLGSYDILDLVKEQLRAKAVDPHQLIFEVTESAAIADVGKAQRFISALKEMGCRFALDDFGVGFSSFSHLKNLPVDYLKIDGSFIRDVRSSNVDVELVRAIVGIAGGLGMRTIAEFVGDAQTLAILGDIGVDYAQGYYIGRPRDATKALNAYRQDAQAA